MGRYVAPADLATRYGREELLDLAPLPDAPDAYDDSVVEAAVADAEAIVDGYLRGRYTLPLATVPGDLLGLTADLARYELRSRSGGINQSTMSDDVKERRDRAIARLKDIQAGRFVLDVGEAQDQGATAVGRVGLAAGGTPIGGSAELRTFRDLIGGGR
jgi:phage gp36-like protein